MLKCTYFSKKIEYVKYAGLSLNLAGRVRDHSQAQYHGATHSDATTEMISPAPNFEPKVNPTNHKGKLSGGTDRNHVPLYKCYYYHYLLARVATRSSYRCGLFLHMS